MRRKFKPVKIPILILMLVLMIGAFTLVYGLAEIATAPHEERRVSEPALQEDPDTTDDPGEPDPSDEPGVSEPADEPVEDPVEDPVIEEFITIQMDDSDISAGNLILVNHDYRFDIPDSLDLVNISDTKTGSYRVQDRSFRLSLSIIPIDTGK